MSYKDILESDRECPFCALDSNFVCMSNAVGYVTPALAPYGEMHALVCSYEHRESVLDFSQEEYVAMQSLVRDMVERFYDMGAQEVTVLVRDSRSFGDADYRSSTSGKSQLHYHIHVLGDVHMTPKHFRTQKESDTRHVLTSDEMQGRADLYAGL